MKLNTKILEKVKKQILEEPRRVHMGPVLVFGETVYTYMDKAPACKTVGCIAGWTHLLSMKKKERTKYVADALLYEDLAADANVGAIKLAEKEIGISTTIANTLFNAGHWPYGLSRALSRANPGTKKYARIVCERIDQFIEHYQVAQDEREFFEIEQAVSDKDFIKAHR